MDLPPLLMRVSIPTAADEYLTALDALTDNLPPSLYIYGAETVLTDEM